MILYFFKCSDYLSGSNNSNNYQLSEENKTDDMRDEFIIQRLKELVLSSEESEKYQNLNEIQQNQTQSKKKELEIIHEIDINNLKIEQSEYNQSEYIQNEDQESENYEEYMDEGPVLLSKIYQKYENSDTILKNFHKNDKNKEKNNTKNKKTEEKQQEKKDIFKELDQILQKKGRISIYNDQKN